MAIHPYQLAEYTPAEADALLDYAARKRDSLKGRKTLKGRE